MKPCGKNIADTQYELIDPFSTHCLKKVTLSVKSSTHEPKGFNDGYAAFYQISGTFLSKNAKNIF